MTVLNKNYGDFNTAWRIWMLEAKPEVCTEEITLTRPTWWTGEDKSATLKVNVIPTPCDTTCEIGKRRASATSC
jgi:hypothetical protein